MKNYREQLNELHESAIFNLKMALKKEPIITFYYFENEDYGEDEMFHELPQQLVFTDPMFDVYYLHKVYLEDNTIYIRGFAPELEEYYVFTVEEINKDTMLTIVDDVLDIVYS